MMMRMLWWVLAVVAGAVVGGCVNMGLIVLGGQLIPAPGGGDVSTPEGLAAVMPLFEPKHFLFPFLAHALGTLVGALVATRLALGREAGPAIVVCVLFLFGGVTAVVMFPAPLWFEVVDLVFAYIPAAWIGHRLASVRPRAATGAR
jgi:hypothetical protein